MKRMLLTVLLLATTGFGFAEDDFISEKQDVCITKMYASSPQYQRYLNDAETAFLSAFDEIERLNIIGMQFEMDARSAGQLIEQIQQMKEDEAFNSSEYIDEDLGIAIIDASELEQLKNAFFVMMPEFSGYEYTQTRVETGEAKGFLNSILNTSMDESSYVTLHKVTVTVTIEMISAEGDYIGSYDAIGEGVMRVGDDARRDVNEEDLADEAIENAFDNLEYYLSTLDEFRLYSIAHDKTAGRILMELGSEMGIEPGTEFVVRTETVFSSGFSMTEETALIRVRKALEGASYAKVVSGSVRPGDKLVEASLTGRTLNFYAGVLYGYEVPTFAIRSVDFTPGDLTVDIGGGFRKMVGYRGLLIWNFGTHLMGMYGVYTEVGAGFEGYLISGLNASISVFGGISGDGIQNGSSWGGIASAYGKGIFELNFQPSQTFKVGVYAGAQVGVMTPLYSFAEYEMAILPTGGLKMTLRF